MVVVFVAAVCGVSNDMWYVQVNTVRSDVNEKLEKKAELKDMEKAAYKSVDAVYKSLSAQISSLQKDLGKAATKEDFHHLMTNKVVVVVY